MEDERQNSLPFQFDLYDDDDDDEYSLEDKIIVRIVMVPKMRRRKILFRRQESNYWSCKMSKSIEVEEMNRNMSMLLLQQSLIN